MQAPGGPEEDKSGGFELGGWLVPHADEGMGKAIDEIFSKADAFLLGRRTYDIFAAYWPAASSAEDPVAKLLNGLPKFVASRTRKVFDWPPTHLIRDVRAEVPRLKDRFSREIQVHGSCGLAQTLIEADLIDEYRLFTFPVILGSGRRLFGPGTIPATLRLVSSRTTEKGTVITVYRRAGKLVTGSF